MLTVIKKLLASKGLLSVITIFITLFLLLLPAAQTSKVELNVKFIDKFIHTTLFAACSFSLFFDFRLRQQSHGQLFIGISAILIFCVAMAIATEVVQEKFLARTFSIHDIYADIVGAVLGIFIAYFSYFYLLDFSK